MKGSSHVLKTFTAVDGVGTSGLQHNEQKNSAVQSTQLERFQSLKVATTSFQNFECVDIDYRTK